MIIKKKKSPPNYPNNNKNIEINNNKDNNINNDLKNNDKFFNS